MQSSPPKGEPPPQSFLMLICIIAVSYLVVLPIGIVLFSRIATPTVATLLGFMAALLFMLAWVLMELRDRKFHVGRELWILPARGSAVLGAFLALYLAVAGYFAFWIFIAASYSVWPEFATRQYVASALPADGSSAEFMLRLLVVVLLAPLVEELMFRRTILVTLLSKYGHAKAVFYSALVFGLMHGSNFLGAIFYGIFLALLYLRFRSLLLNVICHSLLNFFALLLCWAGYLPTIGGPSVGDFARSMTMPLIAGFLVLLLMPWWYRVLSQKTGSLPDVQKLVQESG